MNNEKKDVSQEKTETTTELTVTVTKKPKVRTNLKAGPVGAVMK